MKLNQDLAHQISARVMKNHKSGYSRLISSIAAATVALGIASLIVSSNVYKGFRKEIVKKLFCFAPHVELTKYDTKNVFEELPLSVEMAPRVSDLSILDRVELSIHKSGLLKSAQSMAGVIVRGIDTTFGLQYFKRHIVEGQPFGLDTASRKILIGKKLASLIQVGIDSSVVIYFANQSTRSSMPRPRKLTVCGIYRTGIEEIDATVVLAQIDLIRDLNNWTPEQVGSYGIYFKDFDNFDNSFEILQGALPSELYAERIKDRFPHFFEWFLIIGQNVTIVLTIILFVASFNVAASMLILIIEKTSLIGLLKALGAKSYLIRKIFLITGLKICFKGLLIGNLLGILICFVQDKFNIIPLKAEMYYLDFVPIAYDWASLVIHNLILIPIVFLALLVPTGVILSISPVKAIKFQ